MHRRHLYRNAAYPDGVFGKSTQNIIDLDESKFKIESQNHKFGKVMRKKRCDATPQGSMSMDRKRKVLICWWPFPVTSVWARPFHSIGVTPREIKICGDFTISLMTYATGWLCIVKGGNFYLPWTILVCTNTPLFRI
jgi:hypothetical protein